MCRVNLIENLFDSRIEVFFFKIHITIGNSLNSSADIFESDDVKKNGLKV